MVPNVPTILPTGRTGKTRRTTGFIPAPRLLTTGRDFQPPSPYEYTLAMYIRYAQARASKTRTDEARARSIFIQELSVQTLRMDQDILSTNPMVEPDNKTTEEIKKALESPNKPVEEIVGRKEQERTRIQKKLFLEYFQKTLGMISATVEKVGIDRKTYWRWMQYDEDFAKAIRTSTAQTFDDAEDRLKKGILQDNMRAITYFLDRRHPSYRPRVKIEGPAVGEKSMEDELAEFEWHEDNENYEESKPEIGAGDQVQDTQQAGGNSSVPTEPSPSVLLAAPDKAQLDTQSPTRGSE